MIQNQEMEDNSVHPHENRRRFLTRVSGAIAAVIAMAVGIPLAGYTILPALKRKEPQWADAGAVDELQLGVPNEVDLVVSVTDGWHKTTTKRSAWAIMDDAGAITVYSPICTHLGCGYRWDPEQRKFECPCHNSVFSLDGRVLSGPAPRSLDTLPVKVEGGRLFVMYVEYKAGAGSKIAL